MKWQIMRGWKKLAKREALCAIIPSVRVGNSGRAYENLHYKTQPQDRTVGAEPRDLEFSEIPTMNPKAPVRSTIALGVALGILAITSNTPAWAAAPPLQGQITLRPLTPQEIYDYGLTGVQG